MVRETFNQEHLLHQITNRIRQSLELPEILTTTAQEIRAFLDIDRVKVYRFEPDGSGEVIAESIKENRLPSLLNLRFPATDIPSHAREMFVKARQRVIVDVRVQRQTLNRLDCPETGDSLTQEDIRYSPVDPCHAQYLTTMGVITSLTVPILYQNYLWGLLSIHNATTRWFSERELQIVQLLVDQVSIAISQANLLSQARQQAHHEATINRVSSLLHCPLSLAEVRQRVLEETVGALDGVGGRLYIVAEPTGHPSQLYTYGVQPLEAALEETTFWQKLVGGRLSAIASSPNSTTSDLTTNANSGIDAEVAEWQEGRSLASQTSSEADLSQPLFCTLADLQQNTALQPLASVFEPTLIRSIAIIPLRYRHQYVGCLSIFRSGQDTEILWAGECHQDERNHMPRASFAAWREIKADQAKVWTADEMKLAQSIGLHLYMAVTQKRVETMMRYQASHDSLTHLPNRLLFDEQLSLALVNAHQKGETLAVAFLDLDRFKTINDTLGHAMGDLLLQQASERLRSCLRDCDAIARWGGDEFTLLLPSLTCAEDITRISQRILEQLIDPFQLGAQEVYVTASLGIALAPYDGEDAETLLKNADAAMYRAKQQGKNNWQLYSAEMNTEALEQFALESDLRKAAIKDELLLYYQPQVDLNTGRIVGVEALLRWNHPRLGLVLPSQFVPLAEETGLICPLGNWVLRTACFQHQRWCADGLPPIRVAVNLSARQFQQQNLVQTIVDTLAETGMEPSYLELEITESTAMQDIDLTITILKQLRQMGIYITMDDFGTGYSSLSAIKHFPLHTLKIDQSFVRDLLSDRSDVAIAKAVIALGKGLGLDILAEGVETAEQLSFLRSIDCDTAQGYFFSKPLPATQMSQLLTEHLVVPSHIPAYAAFKLCSAPGTIECNCHNIGKKFQE
jgi:diguanylate cyclase (GGDEF)-like protein